MSQFSVGGSSLGGTPTTLISRVAASNQSAVVFTSGISSAYSYYKLVITGAQFVLNGSDSLRLRLSSNGGSSYDSGANYSYNEQHYSSDNTQGWNPGNAQSSILLASILPSSGTATDNGCYEISLYNLPNASLFKEVRCLGSSVVTATNTITSSGGSYNISTAVNAIQLFNSSGGNIFSGTFSLYGVT